ncbi:hypothetical protein [Chryseobacterium sp. Bi04]|uniref:hypothetical protein n=1 Tax=Chryseobacterium sp. Bi04 TaxID=2822345 RepID=UPI001E507B5D|nr:hypothetical protein [Chryseobacterium sp. Bi04]
MSKAIKMGLGDPPQNGKSMTAFGDIGPMIINDLGFGSTNIYKKGTPKNAPLTGEPPASFKASLLQRSSLKFAQFAQSDKESGYTKGKNLSCSFFYKNYYNCTGGWNKWSIIGWYERLFQKIRL